ncbi:hypothetical protein HYDPIDRAFT_111715, partial [Hydnomerulius pinastri MD-312]
MYRLKDRAVQEEYRVFISKKLNAFWGEYMADPSGPSSDIARRQKKDSQENILILFRKLREGLSSSGRKDSFALEVYETSLYLSVIFDSPVQTTSILSHLVPDMYTSTTSRQPYRLVTVLVLLLHHLLVTYPAQRTYLEQIRQVTPNLLERPSAAYSWISTLARNLRTSNFVQFEQLSKPIAFERLLPPRSISDPKSTAPFPNLPQDVIYALVSRLRSKARDRAWMIVRNSYRELSSSEEMQSWLGRRLCFDNFGCETSIIRFDEWVEERCRDGHLRPKEGVEGRWMVCKAR